MSGLPPTLNPTLAGGVLTLAGRQIQGQYSWAARPTDKFTVDSVDTTLHVAYCRRAGDLVPNNEYPFPYPSNLTLHPGDNVIVEWDPSGPFIVGGGSTGAGNGEVIQHNGLDVGEEPGLNFRDSNPVAFNIVDDPADHRVNLVAAAPLPSEVHLRPGDAFEFLPTAPPELPPIAEALGTGTGPLGLPYYALLYTTAGNPTELGPISFPVDGTTAVAVAIPNIPAENDKATGQILYRSDDFGQTWGAIHGYADLVSHVFTDTGVALGAAPTTFATIAQVQRAYTDAIRGVGTSNDSNLGLGGVTGNGLKVGNVERVLYRPDPATVKILSVTPPEDSPAVSVSTGAGAGVGERQYMKVYHTAGNDSAKGPASRWIDGTLAVGVAIAGVPNFPSGVWDDVTGQAVYRTKKGGGGFFLLQDYPGSRTLQAFIDTTPDSGLGIAWVDEPAIIRAIGLSSCPGTPPGSGDGGTVSGGLPVPGTACTVQPVTLTPPTSGGIPVPGGSSPGAGNAAKPGYDCTGATTTALTPPSPTLVAGSHAGGGQWVVTDSPTSFTESLVDPTIQESSGSIRYAGPSNLAFVLCHVDLHIPTTTSYTGGPNSAPNYGFKAGYGVDFLGATPGLSWQAATNQWVFNRNVGVQTTGGTVLSVQPGPNAWIAFGINCATGHTEYWLGNDIGSLQLAYTDTSGGDLPSATVAFEYFAGSSTANVTIATMDGMQWFTGQPQSLVFNDGGTITGGAPPPVPSVVPAGADSTAYLAGWAAYVAGTLETACPYTGSSGLCLFWEYGWIDAENYYTAAHHDGGTGLSGTYGPPATPPSSVPGAYDTEYTAGYQAFLDGKPKDCPYTSIDANQCLYWGQGWTDAYNAFNTKVAPDGKTSGWLPGGTTASETCLNGGTPLSPDPATTPPASDCGSVPVLGDMTVAGAVTASGPMSAPSFNGLIDGGVWA